MRFDFVARWYGVWDSCLSSVRDKKWTRHMRLLLEGCYRLVLHALTQALEHDEAS